MHKKLSLFIGISCLLLVIGFSSMGWGAKAVPPVMYQFLSKLVSISPYMYNEDQFNADKNDKLIAKNLLELKKLSQDLKHHERLMTPGYEITANYFINNINEVYDAFSSKKKHYAFRLFRSTLHACSNCHTQESSTSSMSWNFSDFSLPKDDFDRANFYYTVRGYDQAWELFSGVVSSYGKKQKNDSQLNDSLGRLLIIALRVQRNPAKFREFLQKLPNRDLMPVYFQNQIQLWISELTNVEKENGYQYLSKKPSEFDQYIDDLYRAVYPFPKQGRSPKVVMEYASGLMFEFINNRPQDKTQAMLFWLGVSNLSLDKFESSLMGEKFLQHCIEDYSPTLISHKCYHALEDQWVIGFSGSSGIHLPIDLEKKLKSYRKKLNIDQPWLN
ncbi:MAG: hypothetical protein KDD46_03510 [Bdellovibrionales bacterium]|nr:hypothetical protein [Bdellovibrionales bacterium]